mgnify:CR=1 FL=1
MLQNIFDAIQDGLFLIDTDLNILRVNKTIESWFPHALPAEGKKCFEVCRARKKPCSICPSLRALESGNLQMDIVPLIESEPAKGWLEIYAFPMFDSSGKPGGIVEYVRNVSDRVRAELALRKSEERFRIIADYTYDWEYWISPRGNFLYVSPSSTRITGYEADYFSNIAGLIDVVVHPEDRHLIANHFEKSNGNNGVSSIQFRIITRNGDERWIAHKCRPVIDDGKYLGRRASNRDITHEKSIETALRKKNDKLKIKVKEQTAYMKRSAEQLESMQERLHRQKTELEKIDIKLVEANNAISALARTIDYKKNEAEKKIALTISSKIMPIIGKLKNSENVESFRTELDILAAYFSDINSGLTNGLGIIMALSGTEMKVATMIKNGLKSNEIANILCTSIDTVKTHRRNIRKKLNIRNSKVNLMNYLRSKWSNDYR